MTEAREETYRRLYASHFDALLGYALRRTDRALRDPLATLSDPR